MISIITPTYNRKILLERLYNALNEQTNKNFEWIIIDDGSTDDTKSLVEQWISDKAIKIKYIYQQNRGKFIAHNTGVQNSSNELCMCIDSDDYPTKNCIEMISRFWEINSNIKYSGIIAEKCYRNGNSIGDKLPDNLKESTLFYINEVIKSSGDKALIYRTDILKKYLFPDIKNVKFITESVIYDQIDCNYKMLIMNEKVCVCEYQPDGYSNNFRELMLRNPEGFNIYYMQRIDMALNIRSRLIYASKYYSFRWLSNDKSYRYEGRYKLIAKFSIPFALFVYMYYKLGTRKFLNEKL